MKMMLTPWALRSAITPISRSVSERVREEVGSSMMTSRASSDSALAISSSWRWASDRSATGVSGLKSAPTRSQQAADLLAELAAVDQPERSAIARLAADEDIGRGVQIVEEVQLLMHEGDAAGHGLADAEGGMLLAVEADLAGAGLDHPAQDLHQRALAGAVLADEADDLAPADGEADLIQSDDARIGLGDSIEFEEMIGHASMRAGAIRRRRRPLVLSGLGYLPVRASAPPRRHRHWTGR